MKQPGAGAALVKVVRDYLPPHVELDPREEALLAAAAPPSRGHDDRAAGREGRSRAVAARLVTRIRTHGASLTFELKMALEFGPAPLWDEFTDEDLEVGWQLFGERILSEWEFRDGSRPWAWWVFEKGEEPPPLEPGADVVRLAELGELSDGEYAALAERAAKARAQLDSGIQCYVATGGGREINFEQEAIDLWERVKEARS